MLTLFTYFAPEVKWDSPSKQKKVDAFRQKLQRYEAFKLIPQIIDEFIDQ